MLTKKDILLLKETFITKEDAKNFSTKDDVATFKDEIMFQILAMCDELAIVIGYRTLIEDHEIRIEKLEEQVLGN